MTHIRPFRKPLGRFAMFASLAAALGLLAVPFALAGTPEGVPPSYSGEENPGSEYMPAGVPPEATPPEGIPPEETPPDGVPVGPPEETPPAGVPVGAEGTAPPEGVTTGPPEGIPHGAPEGIAPSYSGTENPGSAHRLSAGEARAVGRESCQEWKTNFGDNKSQFGRCIADVAKALHGSAAPGRACADMNRKPDENEHRSDFSACVAAAAQALRE